MPLPHLELPTRKVPLAIKFDLYISERLFWMGIILLLIALPVFSANLINSDFRSLYFKPDTAASGRITQINKTGTKVMGETVYALYYSFTINGQTFKDVSYGSRNIDSTVTIEFKQDRPQISKIKGTRFSTIPVYILFFPLIFVGGGIFFIITIHRRIRLAIYLLKHGYVTQGQIIRTETVNTFIKQYEQYRFYFEFETFEKRKASSSCITGRIKKIAPHQTWVLYNLQDPSKAILVDALDGSAKNFIAKW